MKKRTFLLISILLLSLTQTLLANEEGIIEPITNPDRAKFSKSNFDTISKLDETEQRLIYIYYIRGFVDALTLKEYEKFTNTTSDFFKDCEGMSYTQLVETMLKFYRENPQHWDLKPSIVLKVVVPRLRKGLFPLPVIEK